MPRIRPAHVSDRCFGNIDTDIHSSEALRDEVIRTLSTAVGASDAADKYEKWRELVIANGRIIIHAISLGHAERVGRLRYRDSYETELADVLRSDARLGGADESDIEELVKWMFGEPSSMDPNTARFLFDLVLADKPIEASQGWYYRTRERSATPFAHGDPSCLPWRLGLRYVRSGSKYVGFSVGSRAIGNPRYATFVDVPWEYHEFWRPNGTTQPLPGTPAICDNSGLEELVASPPNFRGVLVPTTIVITR